MRYLVLLAGAAAIGLASPGIAKPGNGNGNGHGHGYGHQDDRGQVGYGADGCPPGLRNKGCMPPGQARKLYRGQRYESGYGTLYTYQRIPYDVRRRYRLNARYRYYYDDGTLYAVDPRTMLIAQVISALVR
ncbi:MAG TPA: hypothetical protein VGU01_10435 [Sphingomicrobium sp.]|nr:hypothetical protein [Sphingomicrobium sp.]